MKLIKNFLQYTFLSFIVLMTSILFIAIGFKTYYQMSRWFPGINDGLNQLISGSVSLSLLIGLAAGLSSIAEVEEDSKEEE